MPHRKEEGDSEPGNFLLPVLKLQGQILELGSQVFYANQFPKCLKIYFPLGLEQDYEHTFGCDIKMKSLKNVRLKSGIVVVAFSRSFLDI